METPGKGPLNNVQNFITYMFNESYNKFSDKFTEDDFKIIRNKIGEHGMNKYITETLEYLQKKSEFKFNDFYNKILPPSHSHRRIEKMSNLLGHIINFCRKQIEAWDKNKSNEIVIALNKNDMIVEYLIKNFCNTKDLEDFKNTFAKIYKITRGEDNLEKIISCIHTICKYTRRNLAPNDRISTSEQGKIKIDKAEEIIRGKYDSFAINEDDEDYNTLYAPEENSNTVEEVLINFFKDHKIRELSERIKNPKISKAKKVEDILSNLLDNQ